MAEYTDGPDTELAAAIEQGRVSPQTGRRLATIVRSVLARAAAAPTPSDAKSAARRPHAAPTDGQAPADESLFRVDEPRVAGRCPSCGRESLRATAGGHVVCTRLECPSPTAADDLLHGGPPRGLAPADDTAPQALVVVGRDGRTWRRAGDGFWTQRVNDAAGVFTDAEMLDVLANSAPADDTAAPDTVVVPRVHLRSWVDFLRALVQQDAIRALSARDAALDNARQIESWAGQPVRDSQTEATAAPDAPSVWDSGTAPGGYVCGTCGTPVESEPCAEHQPAGTARTQNRGEPT